MSSSKGYVLHIRNLSSRARHDDIRRAFSKYGHISDVTIPLDYYSGRMKGFAFVEYERSSDAREAQYRLDRTQLLGREIEVEFARGIRRTPAEMMRIQKDRERMDRRDDFEDRDRGGDRDGRDKRRRRSRSNSASSRSPPAPRRGRSPRSRSRSRSGGQRDRGGDRDRERERERERDRDREAPRSSRSGGDKDRERDRDRERGRGREDSNHVAPPQQQQQQQLADLLDRDDHDDDDGDDDSDHRRRDDNGVRQRVGRERSGSEQRGAPRSDSEPPRSRSRSG